MQKIHVKLPPNLNFEWVYKNIQEISSLSNLEIIWDWAFCIQIQEDCICGILHVKELVKSNGLKLTMTNQIHASVKQKFKEIWDCEASERFVRLSSGFCVSPVIAEERLESDIEKMVHSIRVAFNEDEPKDYSALKKILSEVYMNICQHAETQKGFIFVLLPQDDSNTKLKN